MLGSDAIKSASIGVEEWGDMIDGYSYVLLHHYNNTSSRDLWLSEREGYVSAYHH